MDEAVIVADTSVLIEHMRGNTKVRRFLDVELRHGPILVPTLAAWELWKGATSPAARDGVESLLGALGVDSLTPAIARLAGDLYRQLEGKGSRRPQMDLLIASHALHHRCAIATLDRDYSGIPGLKTVKPT